MAALTDINYLWFLYVLITLSFFTVATKTRKSS